MRRSRAAWIAGVVAVLLAATWLLSRRGRAAHPLPSGAAPASPLPAVPGPVVPERSEANSVAAEPPAGEPEPVLASVEDPTVTLAVPAPEPRSWGGDPLQPATRPAPVRGARPADPGATIEQPLPTWARVAIVGTALLAFFAVSLIATKQV